MNHLSGIIQTPFSQPLPSQENMTWRKNKQLELGFELRGTWPQIIIEIIINYGFPSIYSGYNHS